MGSQTRRASASIYLTPEVHELAKRQAEQAGITISDWVTRAIYGAIAAGLVPPAQVSQKKTGPTRPRSTRSRT
jgi:hypothetical protein